MAISRRRLAIDALTAVLAVGGVTLVVIGGGPPVDQRSIAADAAAPQGPPAPPVSPASPAGAPSSVPASLGRSVPVRLDIPAIGVSAAVMELGLNTDGTIAVPPLRADAPAGWYRNMATPGEVGPAVILGHVDTARDGPAVFHKLHSLRPGDAIAVHRQDGSTATFTVGNVVQYPKSTFPTEAVYGPVNHPALRLVTCGGTFDRVRRTYRGNVVVYADLSTR
jgi:sortase (surface protein transpeptidase)